MATYTHFEVANSPSMIWEQVMPVGPGYTANSNRIVIPNIDGTVTSLLGNFTVVGTVVAGGDITSMLRTNNTGTETYEQITGMSTNAVAFLTSPNGITKLALVLSGIDTLNGYSGPDHLDGHAGMDTMAGGAGHDQYFVDNIHDIVIEAPNEGRDAVITSLDSYTLGANVETLAFTGAGQHFGTGNELDNAFSSGSGTDTFWGLAGADQFFGDNSSGDTFVGGTGDDYYAVRPGDTVVELPGEGIDRVQTGIPNYVLPANVEKLTVDGAPGVVFGNELDNTINKNTGSGVTIYGLGGNDTLTGGGVGDTLDGGDGDDTAVFQGNLNEHSFLNFGNGILVSGLGSPDAVFNIEHLKFDDGMVDLNDGSALFDTLYYMTHNLDVFHAGVNALDHFNNFGRHEGRDPNAFFSVNKYLDANPDVKASGMNPLDHYDQIGWHQGRDPSLNFDTRLYLVHNPDVAAAGIDPLAHYLANGMAEGRQAYAAIGTAVNGFDAEYYLMHNPDVAAAGVDPLAHFNANGWHEGRNPNAYFDTNGYLAHYADVAASGMNPLTHYEQFGWQEGRDPSAGFDTNGYLAANPDVAAAHINPLDHFINNGIYEGRMAINDGVWH